MRAQHLFKLLCLLPKCGRQYILVHHYIDFLPHFHVLLYRRISRGDCLMLGVVNQVLKGNRSPEIWNGSAHTQFRSERVSSVTLPACPTAGRTGLPYHPPGSRVSRREANTSACAGACTRRARYRPRMCVRCVRCVCVFVWVCECVGVGVEVVGMVMSSVCG